MRRRLLFRQELIDALCQVHIKHPKDCAALFISRLAMIIRFTDSHLRNFALIFEIDWTLVRNTSLMAIAS